MDLNGNFVASGCLKQASDEEIIKRINQFGKPVLIASDTRPPSHFVKKLAARLCARVYHPRKSLTQFEKRNIAKGILDPHIRDSYAAAVKAYRRYANRFRNIEKLDVKDKDKLKLLVISGKRVSEALKKPVLI